MAALHHVGLTVRDLDRAPDLHLGVPGAALRCAILGLEGGALELLESSRPASPNAAPLVQNALGAHHVAFRVPDASARKAELEARGVHFPADVRPDERAAAIADHLRRRRERSAA